MTQRLVQDAALDELACRPELRESSGLSEERICGPAQSIAECGLRQPILAHVDEELLVGPAQRTETPGSLELLVAEQSVAMDVYDGIALHQRTENWFGRELVGVLQTWADRFIAEFNLDIPQVVIGIDSLPCTRYGQFRLGHNGLGLRGEITLNSRYLDGRRPLWEVLGTLLHELLHGWQQAHGAVGKRNHHNQEFRDKARDLGLLIDKRGLTGYAASGAFKALLAQFGVDAPAVEIPIPDRRPRGESKQKKWSCGCTIGRFGVAAVNLRCETCGNLMQRCG